MDGVQVITVANAEIAANSSQVISVVGIALIVLMISTMTYLMKHYGNRMVGLVQLCIGHGSINTCLVGVKYDPLHSQSYWYDL